MTDRIPDEIMREARDLFEDPHFRPFRSDNCIREVAKALLARDQRAAEIARRKIVSGIYAGTAEWPDGEDIADAILTYDEDQK